MVVFQDASAHYSRHLSNRLVEIAQQRDIPVQRAIFQQYRSDAAAHLKRDFDVSLLAHPTRYTHSPIETVIERGVKLLVAFATTFR